MMVDRRTVTVPRSAVVGLVVAAFIGIAVLAAIGMAWFHQGERLDAIATEGQRQAERNTELLSIECNTTTGEPMRKPGKRYINDPRLLDAHCAKQRRQAADIAAYIDTIKTGTAEQITTSEGNILSRLDDVKAAVERRPAPVVIRVPIPRPTSPTSATAPRAGASTPAQPPAAPPSTAATAPKPQPVGPAATTTTTRCETRGKSEKCR